jgi:hypothetical protein
MFKNVERVNSQGIDVVHLIRAGNRIEVYRYNINGRRIG